MANQPESKFVLVDNLDRMACLRNRKDANNQKIHTIGWTRDLQKATVNTQTTWERLLRKVESHQDLPYWEFHEVVSLTHFKEDLEKDGHTHT